ncbi:MAG: DEAD/DEAH box helicase family protein [Candidatus Sericytochromatia bacterium]|nr:DEAD/DEAH box helicase family protein [Candidatus Sericytochromatia bacterium]
MAITDENNSLIRDNRSKGSVGSFLKDNILPNAILSVVSAYFTVDAFNHEKLKDKFNSIESMRFLFGEPTFVKNIESNQYSINFKIKKDLELAQDNDSRSLTDYLKQRSRAKECADWIEKKVEIRSMIKPNFLHGKLYHINNTKALDSQDEPIQVITGSSNFTVNGLGLGKHANMELNTIVDSRLLIKNLYSWFDDLWKSDGTKNTEVLVEDVKDEVLKYLRTIYTEKSPECIYYKTLYHIFNKYLEEQQEIKFSLDEVIGFKETKIWNALYEFQKDAVKAAIGKINKYNGCIIADSVGLGKTFEALAVIKYFELRNKSVLVLCPKKLSDNWSIYSNNDQRNTLDPFRFHLLYHTDLSRASGKVLGNTQISNFVWNNYDLVVIDESHNFRNNSSSKSQDKKSRYSRLLEDIIIKSNGKTKVLLLSATPVNNTLIDLKNQIHLITAGKKDSLFDSIQVKDIDKAIKNAQNTFINWSKKESRSVVDLVSQLDNSQFIKILDSLTIARSRKHIENHYGEELEKIGAFPKRLANISKTPLISSYYSFPSYKELNDEIEKYKSCLFNPSAYLKSNEGKEKNIETNLTENSSQETKEFYLIGMLKVNFLKRLESSIKSFELSLGKTIKKIEEFEFRVQRIKETGSKEQINLDQDSEISQENDEDDDINENFSFGKLEFKPEDLNLDRWIEDLKSDKEQLQSIYKSALDVTNDSKNRDEKLNVLKKLIKEKIDRPININSNVKNKKVLIFTTYADTAKYLYENLESFALEEMKINIAIVTGTREDVKSTFKPHGFINQNDFNSVLTNFSPLSKNRKELSVMPQEGEIDILIATDCISEGQNLQDCDYLINYDIHWNPVRIIQRFGRIDRLGSKNKYIQMVNFWPTDDLNIYINLKDRVQSRMTLANLSATANDNVLEDITDEERERLITNQLSYRDKQLSNLKEENKSFDLEEMSDSVSLTDLATLDNFRVELSNHLKDEQDYFEKLPLGLYAVVPSPIGDFAHLNNYNQLSGSQKDIIKKGVIFCFRQNIINKDNEEANPMYPYFLIYIYDDGHVRFNYGHSKQILDLLQILCKGVTEPYDVLCDIFNQETNNGENMSKYTNLIIRSIESLGLSFNTKVNKGLQNKVKSPINEKDSFDADKFELVTWLVVN